uniref:LSM domain-containing protein n=1 Tax=Aegilops tauschii subsp. strangulata TaxID=200361 RepID=A0A453DB04_AEGTS
VTLGHLIKRTMPLLSSTVSCLIILMLQFSFLEQDDPLKLSTKTRQLGLIVCRGTAVMLVSPTDGTDEIANPFLAAEGAS